MVDLRARLLRLRPVTGRGRFLNCMGGSVRGAGTSRLVITGVKELHDTEFTIMPDRIVAGTYMLMTAAAGGEVLLRDAPLEQLED